MPVKWSKELGKKIYRKKITLERVQLERITFKFNGHELFKFSNFIKSY